MHFICNLVFSFTFCNCKFPKLFVILYIYLIIFFSEFIINLFSDFVVGGSCSFGFLNSVLGWYQNFRTAQLLEIWGCYMHFDNLLRLYLQFSLLDLSNHFKAFATGSINNWEYISVFWNEVSLFVVIYSNFGDLKPKLKLLSPSSIEYVMGEKHHNSNY